MKFSGSMRDFAILGGIVLAFAGLLVSFIGDQTAGLSAIFMGALITVVALNTDNSSGDKK